MGILFAQPTELGTFAQYLDNMISIVVLIHFQLNVIADFQPFRDILS